jgi:uncharacterized protein
MQDQKFQLIKNFLVDKMNPSFIIVFGSFAKQLTHKDSDIDISVYNKDNLYTTYEVFMIAQELADILKTDVDLIDFRSASTIFQAQIVTTGKVIYSNDEVLRMNVEMLTLSMYAKLNEERKSIIQKVDESGTIYEK